MPAHKRSRDSPVRQVCESVAHPRYGEVSPMNQSVDGKGRAAINVHQAQLFPLQIAEGSYVGVNATGCKRPNAHTRPGKLDGTCTHEGTHIGFRRAVADRKRGVQGTGVNVRVDLGGRQLITTKKIKK